MKDFSEFCKEYLLSRCEVVDESWNDELELTPEVIEAIKEQCPDEVEWYVSWWVAW